MGVASVVLVAVLLVPFRDDVTSATPALMLVLPCVLAALVGGRIAGLGVAVFAAGAFNLMFLESYGTIKVDSVDDAIAFAVFALAAFTVATLVAREAERRRAADQRRLEVESLWRQNELMQAEQARLAAAKQALEAVDAQRSALLRSVSHDLRTPLAAIRAVVSDLRDGVAYEEAARQDLLELVVDETERLDRLVHNLLSMSRIEAGSLQPDRQAIPIDELLGDRVHRLGRAAANDDGDGRRRPDLPLVSADYTMVEQVVTNLLENAVRHSPPGSPVTVGAAAPAAIASKSRCPTTVPASILATRRGCSARSSGARTAARAGSGWPSARPSSRRTVARSRSGRRRDGPTRGARFTFTLPVHHG